jgi:hypothetical protein
LNFFQEAKARGFFLERGIALFCVDGYRFLECEEKENARCTQSQPRYIFHVRHEVHVIIIE